MDSQMTEHRVPVFCGDGAVVIDGDVASSLCQFSYSRAEPRHFHTCVWKGLCTLLMIWVGTVGFRGVNFSLCVLHTSLSF